MKRRTYKWLLPAGILMMMPRLAVANMNGGLHIPDWVIFVGILLLIIFVASIFLSLFNVQLKKKGIRIFNIIVWVPLMVAGVATATAGAFWPVFIPLLQLPLILLSIPSKNKNHEATEEV